MRWSYYFVLIILFCSCNSSRDLTDNVSNLTLEIDHREVLNIGSTFHYEVIATLKSGGQKKIKDAASTLVQSNQIVDLGNNRAQITGYLQDLKTTAIPCTISLQIDSFSFETADSIDLNFKGPIVSQWLAEKGTDGEQPRASTATLFSRDGLTGRNGTDGSDGGNGPDFIAYLWMEENELILALFADNNPRPFFYRSTERESVILTLNGSDGGSGGNGGIGGDGKPGKADKPAGNGANGGNGGRAGNGGNGGSVVLFLHSDIDYMASSILLNNAGGQAGTPGAAGTPGLGGKGFKDQNDGMAGSNGTIGAEGISGIQGPPIKISIVSFDPEKLLNYK